MKDTILKRTLAVLAVFLMLGGTFATASAQISGGMKETPVEEEEEEEGPVGACATRNDDDVLDPEDAGITGRRAYESPQFGYTVDWNRDWMLDDYFETPAISFLADERDALCLLFDDDALFAYVYVVGQASSRGGPDADLDEWTDDDYIESSWPDFDVDLLLADASRDTAEVVYLIYNPEADYTYLLVFLAVEMSDGSMLYITFNTNADAAEETYTSIAENLLIDGDPVFTLFEWDDIEAEM